MKPLLVALSALSISSSASAETLVIGWNSSRSAVLDTYPQSTPVTVGSNQALEAKGVDFDGIHWKLARFGFDRSGHVSSLQLVADGDVASQLKSKLAAGDSLLWNPMSDDLVRASAGGQSDSVMLCGDGEHTTLTYNRPPSAGLPLTLTASIGSLAADPVG
jgi:hypothetical protein